MLRQKERTVHTVNPGQTSYFKGFYGDDKTDRVDARCVAAITLHQLQKIIEDKEVMKRNDTLESLRSAVN